jgi:hypothetical protein
MFAAWLRRAVGRRLGRVLPADEVVNGWYTGNGAIQPYDLRPILMVGARRARRLHFGDEVRFVVHGGKVAEVEVTRPARQP